MSCEQPKRSGRGERGGRGNVRRGKKERDGSQ